MTYQQLAKALEAALCATDSASLHLLQDTLRTYTAANPRSVEQARKAPLMNALLDAIANADARPAPLPELLTVEELLAAFARAGYAYERLELHGDALSASGGCPLLRRTANRTGVYSYRYRNEEGKLETGHAYVSRDTAGHLRAEH